MTREELFKDYEETLARLDRAYHEAKEITRAALREQLKAYRNEHHRELKAIRVMEQKTKRSKKNAG